jgi:fibrillarin-like rRNA methylase
LRRTCPTFDYLNETRLVVQSKACTSWRLRRSYQKAVIICGITKVILTKKENILIFVVCMENK